MSCVANNGVVSVQSQPALVHVPFNDLCEDALMSFLAGRQTAATPPERGAAGHPGGPTPLCSAGKLATRVEHGACVDRAAARDGVPR